MKIKILINITISICFTFISTSCDPLGKMLKNQTEIKYTLSPNPIEMIGDSIQFNIIGKFNPKLFPKKVTFIVTPVIKYAGGEKTFRPVTLVGESAIGSGQKVMFSTGGAFNYASNKIAFEPAMRNAKIELRAIGQVKNNEKAFDPIPLADGTIASSLLVRNDEKGILAKDALQKIESMNQTTHIYYAMNESNVRATELKTEEMKAINAFIINNLNSPIYEFKGISVSAFASPDGETDKNENLAKDRANSGSAAVMSEFKKNKDKKVIFGKTKDQFQVATTKEDWDGFKSLMEKSDLADKELILRVLTMYPDAEQRRKEIKNLSKTYTELSDKILPKLRRSEISVNVNKTYRGDNEITRLANSAPDSLSVEELLYAGTLTNDVNNKVQIYQAAEKKYNTDWRTSNNLGCALLTQNKVNEAGEAFKRAEKSANGSQTMVYNNLGVIESKNGNRVSAMEYYKKASSDPETKYNMGIIEIRNGKYADALSNFGDFNGHNKALAQLLSGTGTSVKSTIDASNEKDMAYSFYLKAIANARSGNTPEAIANLKTATEKDSALKAYLKNDAEFIKLRSDASFSALVN